MNELLQRVNGKKLTDLLHGFVYITNNRHSLSTFKRTVKKFEPMKMYYLTTNPDDNGYYADSFTLYLELSYDERMQYLLFFFVLINQLPTRMFE